MAKKSLIVGACNNYDFNQLRPWVKSIEHSGFDGDKAMVVFNASFETVDELVANGIHVIAFDKSEETRQYTHTPIPGLTIHVERFLHLYRLLKDKWQDYEWVITTDVRDVVFQSNPVDWLDANVLAPEKMVVGSESIQYLNEPWGNQNLLDTYGPYFHEEFKNNEIYNVGTLGGKSEYIKDLCRSIFLAALNKPIPIVDQAVFNVLIQGQPYKDTVFFAKQSDGWALQAGTTADPAKIDQFRPHLLEPEPVFLGGIALTAGAEKRFCIFHQYDRIPDRKAKVEDLYV